MQHVGKMETLCVASATTPPYSISFQSLLLYDGKKDTGQGSVLRDIFLSPNILFH